MKKYLIGKPELNPFNDGSVVHNIHKLQQKHFLQKLSYQLLSDKLEQIKFIHSLTHN